MENAMAIKTRNSLIAKTPFEKVRHLHFLHFPPNVTKPLTRKTKAS